MTISASVDTLSATPAAAAKIAELLASEGDASLMLRVAVRPGGCSGYSYDLYFDSEVCAEDNQFQFGDDVSVVVDPQSLPLLKGAVLDYKDSLQGAGFNINNPNATRSCGCGQSFS